MPVSRNQTLGFRRSHAFVIGINAYPNLNANLKTAVKDSVEIAKRLKGLQGFDHVLLMNDIGKAQMEILLAWLQDENRPSQLEIVDQQFPTETPQYTSQVAWLKHPEELTEAEKAQDLKYVMLDWESEKWGHQKERLYLAPEAELDIQPEDSIVFYYAGHGFPGEFKSGPAGYLAPTDAINKQTDNESLLPMNEVYQALSKVNCKHTLLILDCCFAGKFRFSSLSRAGSRPFIQPLYKRRYERYKSSDAWQVLVSAGPDQTANDSAKWARIRDHSPFAKTLIDALEGKADAKTMSNRTQGDGIITAHELFLYVWDQVEEITAKQKVQHPGLFPMEQHREGEFIFINPNVEAGQFKFAKDPDRNPYKGLVAYEPEDADLFFGRDSTISSLLRKIPFQASDEMGQAAAKSASPVVVFITAPSAAGKSSLVKAGLFPALQKNLGYDELLIFRPAVVLQGQSILPEEGEHKGTYRREAWQGFSELTTRLQDRNKNQMILVDQFEEFFTELSRERERQAFENQLLKLIENEADQRQQPLLILITMRNDVEWQMMHTKLGKRRVADQAAYWRDEGIYRLQPMDLDELRQALTGPAWWAMHDFKNQVDGQHEDDGEELINQVLKDVMYYPAALPLLSCVMKNFYEQAKEKGRKQKLVKADYDSSQGVAGALSSNAEQFYQKQDEPTKALMRRIILRMVNTGNAGYFRRKVTYFEPSESRGDRDMEYLYELDYGKDYQQLKRLIDDMEAAHLLIQGKTPDNIPIVEPAHDALINHWPRCLGWIQEFGRDYLVLQRQLWQAVLENKKRSEDKREADNSIAMIQEPLPAGFGQAEDVLTGSSTLWDNSPKLLEVLNIILFRTADAKGILSDEQDLTEVSHSRIERWKMRPENQFDYFWDLLSSLTDEEMRDLFLKSDHWLNRAEINFIIDSWNRKEDRFNSVKKERDEAVAAKELAEKQTAIAVRQMNISQAKTLSIVAQQKAREHQFTDALQFALAAYKKAAFPRPSVIYQAIQEIFRLGKQETIPVQVAQLAKNSIRAIVPDGSALLVSTSKDMVQMVDLYGRLIVDLGQVATIRFSPNGQKILVSKSDGTIRILDLKGKLLANLGVQKDLQLVPQSERLWTIKEGDVLHITDLKGNLILEVRDVHTAKFFPSGQNALIVGEDYMMRIVHVETGRETSLNQEYVGDIFFAPSGQHVFVDTQDQQMRKTIYDLKGKCIELDIEDNLDRFSPDGQFLLFSNGADYYRLSILDLQGNELGSNLNDVQFSTDGQRIMTISQNTVKVWHTEDRSSFILTEHTETIQYGLFSPNNQYVLTHAFDKLALWDLASQKKTPIEINHNHKQIRSYRFSPDSQYILTTAKGESSAILWDLHAQKRQTYSLPAGNPSSAMFSDDSERILLYDANVKVISLYNVKGNNPLLAEFGRNTLNKPYRFVPNGHLLYGNGGVWRLLKNLSFEFDKFTKLVFSPDGQRILTYNNYVSPKIWSLKGDLLTDLFSDPDIKDKPKFTSGESLTFSADGERVLIRGHDFWIWDYTKKRVKTLGPNSAAYVLAKRDRILIRNDYDRGEVKKSQCLWDSNGKLLTELPWFKNPVFSPDGLFFLTILNASGLPEIPIWNHNGKQISVLRYYENEHYDPVDFELNKAYFFSDNIHILTVSSNGVALIWDLNKAIVVGRIPESSRQKTFSPVGSFFLSHSKYGPTQVWDSKGTLMADLGLDIDTLFSPKGWPVLSYSEGGIAKLWNEHGENYATLKHHDDVVLAKFSPNAERLLTISKGGIASLWDNKGKHLHDMNTHTGEITSACFTPDGQLILTASEDQTAKLWDLKGNLLVELNGYRESFTDASFSPDGTWMLCRYKDGTVKMWPLLSTYASWLENLWLLPLPDKEKKQYEIS